MFYGTIFSSRKEVILHDLFRKKYKELEAKYKELKKENENKLLKQQGKQKD